jgi:hypothetical protein
LNRILDIYAGPTAYNLIKEQGLTPDIFDFMLGASGGPKWFTLAGLDKVIFPEFFADRTRPLNIIGSSAGAFRFACFAQQDPLSAINRLAERYSTTTYSDKPDAAEITSKGIALLDYVLGSNGSKEIVTNEVIHAHFVVARCKGLTKFEPKPLQLAGLLGSASANALNRGMLKHFYERVMFSSPLSNLKITDPYKLPTQSVHLSVANLSKALMASGSIPVVLEGVTDIDKAPRGVYRDGGIVDYHFDLEYGPSSGLVLYPHFYSKAIPGWFDKSLSYRKPQKGSFDKVVMLVPSEEFVSQLPYAKIPDRKDFENMPAEQRIPYWQSVISQSDALGEAFQALADKQDIVDFVKPITFCA